MLDWGNDALLICCVLPIDHSCARNRDCNLFVLAHLFVETIIDLIIRLILSFKSLIGCKSIVVAMDLFIVDTHHRVRRRVVTKPGFPRSFH